jgi:hypothetical protein
MKQKNFRREIKKEKQENIEIVRQHRLTLLFQLKKFRQSIA